MIRYIFISLMLVLSAKSFSQKLEAGKYWVTLKDKKYSEYSLSKPEEFLSERALSRRADQNIKLSEEDLPVSEAYIDSLKNLGLTILGKSKWFNAAIVESSDTLLLDTLGKYSYISGFNYREPKKKAVSVPNPFIRPARELNKTSDESLNYGLSLPQVKFLNGDKLHDMGFRGNGIQIAVIDGGFYGADTIPAFDSLWINGQILGYRDFSHSKIPFFLTHPHGMSVLSTIGSNIPGVLIGTAPAASFYLLKSEIVESESRLEEAYWAIAAEFADSAGADIISSSLGYSSFDEPELSYSYSDMDGKTTLVTRVAEKAFSKGMVVVVSAGNEGNNPWRHITAPSDGPHVLCIGASDTSGTIARFSSRGPSADLRTKPDIIAVGYQARLVNSSGHPGSGNGTSFSAPQVAGMIACLWEAAPEKSNFEIEDAVRRSASHYSSPDDSSGYGVPDFMKALFLLKMNVDPAQSDRLTVYPNPNSGNFEIRLGEYHTGQAKISIYDVNGNKVADALKTLNGGVTEITELSGHAPGTYLIVASYENRLIYSGLMILRR
jgi:serine protease AprX